jgi:NADH dehydrogenase [ubiquinone] 1 alpha subcomplex assembly factor 1
MQRFIDELILFNFTQPASMAGWSSINDVVMGGLSEGGVRWLESGRMLFWGSVSLKNKGGFASIRSADINYDLTGLQGILLTALGDGKRYKFTARTDLSFDGISYQKGFTARPAEVTEYFLPFEDFLPTYHGRKLPDHPSLNQSIIKRFGFIIADSQEGPFSLEVAKISAVR